MAIVVFGWWAEAKRSVIIAPSSPEVAHVVPQATVVPLGAGRGEVDSAPEEAIAPVQPSGDTHEE